MQGVKVLVTGASGQIGLPLVEHLAAENEVWGVARFRDPEARERLAAAGAVAHPLDLAEGTFEGLPDDFDYVVHLATYGGRGDDDEALRTDAEGTALLLQHCSRARAALVMSTGAVYRPHEDPMHAYVESDALGTGSVPGLERYSVTKIAEEAVARSCARQLGVPIVIARMNSAYGAEGGMVTSQLRRVVAGKPVLVGGVGTKYSPIHQDDINGQLDSLLDAASVPATIVNWGGDDVAGPEDWCALAAEITGQTVDLRVQDGGYRSSTYDSAKRRAITGACSMTWQDGVRRVLATLVG
jgi:nucleoside-diphosphate-sugar epimerase